MTDKKTEENSHNSTSGYTFLDASKSSPQGLLSGVFYGVYLARCFDAGLIAIDFSESRESQTGANLSAQKYPWRCEFFLGENYGYLVVHFLLPVCACATDSDYDTRIICKTDEECYSFSYGTIHRLLLLAGR